MGFALQIGNPLQHRGHAMLFRPRTSRPLNLALQGGGAHGAFTWGVLDALLEDGRLDFEGVSGTSAGAMNAVVLAHGLLQGGRDGAREALANFWQAVAGSAPLISAGADPESGSLPANVRMMLYWMQQLSPQQFNPLDINPLRDIVSAQIDFERLRAACPLELFIAATHANSGRLRLFRNHELNADSVLASACLPTLHHAVEIDGEPYWDGAYAANPAVFPLLYECASRDILLVLLSTAPQGASPHTPQDIHRRSLELAFKSTFLREMHGLAHARRYAGDSLLPLGRLERRLRQARFHLIDAGAVLAGLAAESRLTTCLPFLQMLRDRGRAHARAWLDASYPAVGRDSSVDIQALF